VLLLITYVAVALGISFLCSTLEAVVLSITPAYVGMLEDQGHPCAAQIRRIRGDVDRPLAAILTLNTIAHTVGAALAGAQTERMFGSRGIAVFSAVLTFLILIVAEIIPKSIAATHWRRLAPLSVPVLRLLVITLYPVVALTRWITRRLTGGHREPTVSREEIAALTTEGEREGVVAPHETRVVANLLALSTQHASDAMTQIGDVAALPCAMRLGEVLQQRTIFHYSRIPLYEVSEGRRRITRYALKDDILGMLARDEHDASLGTVGRPMLAVPASMPLPEVFDAMTARQEHIALALGEDGRPVGVVTMEDIIETLLGMEIFDESDPQLPLVAAR